MKLEDCLRELEFGILLFGVCPKCNFASITVSRSEEGEKFVCSNCGWFLIILLSQGYIVNVIEGNEGGISEHES